MSQQPFDRITVGTDMTPLNSQSPSPSRFKRLVRRCLQAIAALCLAALLWIAYSLRDRNPGYTINVRIDPQPSHTSARPLRAGFSREKINPNLNDPQHPVWLAGFSNGRAATRIHDDLWAVASVLDDGYSRLGIVVIDAIGFFHDDVIAVRKAVPASAQFDYVVVCSTHNHSTPDLMGLWGPHIFRSGVDRVYRQQVIDAAVKSLTDAAAALQPARMESHEIPTPPDGLVADTRKPDVYDADLRVLLFRSTTSPTVLGSIVNWGNHPETPWSRNTEITADFPGILREALEDGIRYGDELKLPGLGGIHLFANGCVGGLMTTHPSVTVRDPFLQRDFKEPSHDKTRALGHQLARRILDRIASSNVPTTTHAPIGIQARTVHIPLDNKNFLLAIGLGVLERGQARWLQFRTEIAALTIGEASIACIPGEIYPELVNGGVVRAPGADFDIDPVEIPPIREWMPGKIKLVFGLANDEIGYIIPKSEWDTQAPYLYGKTSPVYGEVNSVGPETAGILHKALRELVVPSRAPSP